MAETLGPILVPLQLEAFILNKAVCGTDGDSFDTGARIIPIIQPNYTSLNPEVRHGSQNDVLRHADVHNTAPWTKNPRMADLASTSTPPTPLRHRYGVYLHWTLPRAYRTSTATPPSDDTESSGSRPTSTRQGARRPPTFWIVIRMLDMDSIRPAKAESHFKECQAWVVESDCSRTFDDIPPGMDMEVEVSPFVGSAGEEVFIGRKTPLEDWLREAREGRSIRETDIDLLGTGNPLFADFQMHNTNVFSILDNFEYPTDSVSEDFLAEATASYYLLGWHRREDLDPLWNNPQNDSLEKQLKALSMSLNTTGEPILQSLAKSTDPARILCHGAMYDVKWNAERKPKSVPADGYSAIVQDHHHPAIAVGTGSLDSLVAYCKSRLGHENDHTIGRLEEDILALDSLLHAKDDGLEGQRQAKDLSFHSNFARSPGGTRYFLGNEKDKDSSLHVTPSAMSRKILRALNQHSLLIAACERASRQYRWDIFSAWWEYVGDEVTARTSQQENAKYRKRVEGLSNVLKALDARVRSLKGRVNKLRQLTGSVEQQSTHEPLPLKTGTLPFFHDAQDPTILIGGVNSGWPSDYLEDVKVRVFSQVIRSELRNHSLHTVWTDIARNCEAFHAPEILARGVMVLLDEFQTLSTNRRTLASRLKVHPQFHDLGPDQRWRDRWGDRQPWFPLFAEWELEYTHIPFNNWVLSEHVTRQSDNKNARYGISADDGKPLWERLGPLQQQDTRVLSGRSLVLPQPSFSLVARVNRLFADTPYHVLEECLDKEKRDRVLAELGKISYLSFPLSGLTDGLVTLARGTHVKPESLASTGAGIYEAAGFTREVLDMISGNSALTPFASAVGFTNDTHHPFKPVTHGQFRFRKLNIIDKFGQALVVQPPQSDGHTPPLHPCISDFYEPQVLDGAGQVANTVIRAPPGLCEFVQLPPRINQPARLNADFAIRTPPGYALSTGEAVPWRPTTEWDNPVWGWVLVNNADCALQFFLPGGEFHCEVRPKGLNGTSQPKWSPFSAMMQDDSTLDDLVEKLQSNNEYLQGFWDMVTSALDNLPPTPDSYADFLASVVGKPLALVTMGWSLELAGPPLRNQSSSTTKDVGCNLLRDYTFPVRLGDKDRHHDGLIGYFDIGLEDNQERLNLNRIYTHFSASDNPSPHLTAIGDENYPELRPYWVDPFQTGPSSAPVSPQAFIDLHNRQLRAFGVVMDPFLPIHAFCDILPAKALELPTWNWHEALRKMPSFFHAGPVILTQDVPQHDSSQCIKAESLGAKVEGLGVIGIPGSGGDSDWCWLQSQRLGEGGDGLGYNAYRVGNEVDLVKPGFQKGPYVAVEGILHIGGPGVTGQPNS